MAGVLRLCGVEKAEIAKWALKQADRHRFIDLIRVARGLPAAEAGEKAELEPPADAV